MLRDDLYELPYFDETGNDYIREIKRQDAYLKRGGKMSAPQMLKYDNRVSMLVERLILIHEAVRTDAESLKDYLSSLEDNRQRGALPDSVFQKFQDKLQKHEEEKNDTKSERERDRLRVIQGGVKEEFSNLSDMPVEALLAMHKEQQMTNEVLYQQLSMREKAGMKLPRMDRNLWGNYRSWVAEKRRSRRRPQRYE